MHVDHLASYATILKFVLYQNSIVKSEHIIKQASTSFFYGWIKNQNYKKTLRVVILWMKCYKFHRFIKFYLFKQIYI